MHEPLPSSLLKRAEAEWPRAVIVAAAIACAPIAFASGTMLLRGLPAVAEQAIQWSPIVLFWAPLAVVLGVASTLVPGLSRRRVVALALALELALFLIGALLGPATIRHRKPPVRAQLPYRSESRTGRSPTAARRGNIHGSHHVLSA
jgi:hypothetical protein